MVSYSKSKKSSRSRKSKRHYKKSRSPSKRKSRSPRRKSRSASPKRKYRSRTAKRKSSSPRTRRFSACHNVSKVSCLSKSNCRWNYSLNKCQGIGKIEWQGRQAEFISRGTITPVYKAPVRQAGEAFKNIREELQKKLGYSEVERSDLPKVVKAIESQGVAPTEEVVEAVFSDVPIAPPLYFF